MLFRSGEVQLFHAANITNPKYIYSIGILLTSTTGRSYFWPLALSSLRIYANVGSLFIGRGGCVPSLARASASSFLSVPICPGHHFIVMLTSLNICWKASASACDESEGRLRRLCMADVLSTQTKKLCEGLPKNCWVAAWRPARAPQISASKTSARPRRP